MAFPTPVLRLLAMLPAFLISIVLQLAVQLFTTPFLQTYQTYMFVDQVHRSELPPQQYGYGTPGYGYPGGQPGQHVDAVAFNHSVEWQRVAHAQSCGGVSPGIWVIVVQDGQPHILNPPLHKRRGGL